MTSPIHDDDIMAIIAIIMIIIAIMMIIIFNFSQGTLR